MRDAVSLAGSSKVVTRVPLASSTAPKMVSAASAAIPAEAGTYTWTGTTWRTDLGPYLAGIGTKGFTATPHENDGYTPVGQYRFTTVFGASPNPGTKFQYRRATVSDHWVTDPGSKLYNTFRTGPSAGRWSSAESLYPVTDHGVVAATACVRLSTAA